MSPVKLLLIVGYIDNDTKSVKCVQLSKLEVLLVYSIRDKRRKVFTPFTLILRFIELVLIECISHIQELSRVRVSTCFYYTYSYK